MFIVLELNRELAIEVGGVEDRMTLSFADGMLGAMPVFDKEEDAAAYAGDDLIVVELYAWGEAEL